MGFRPALRGAGRTITHLSLQGSRELPDEHTNPTRLIDLTLTRDEVEMLVSCYAPDEDPETVKDWEEFRERNRSYFHWLDVLFDLDDLDHDELTMIYGDQFREVAPGHCMACDMCEMNYRGMWGIWDRRDGLYAARDDNDPSKGRPVLELLREAKEYLRENDPDALRD